MTISSSKSTIFRSFIRVIGIISGLIPAMLLMALPTASVRADGAPMAPAENLVAGIQRPKPNPYRSEVVTYTGNYAVELLGRDGWTEVGRVSAGKFYLQRRVELPLGQGSATTSIRIKPFGGGAAHIDSLLLDGRPPVAVKGATIKKLSRKDYDVDEVTGKSVEVTFDSKGLTGKAVLELTARIEPTVISKTPFHFPSANHEKPMKESSEFYSYNWNSRRGALRADGELSGEKLGQPFVADSQPVGSGHPEGTQYFWVMNDDTHLYVAIDVTPDNTADGGKDYGKVYVKTDDGLREFKIDTGHERWGRAGFIYTDKVVWQHKVYEFALPLEAIGMEPGGEPRKPIQLAFATYGTASPSPSGFSPLFAGEGREIIISGSWFQSGAVTSVTIGGLTVPSVIADSQITVTVGNGTAGAVYLVWCCGADMLVPGGNFTFLATPTGASASPGDAEVTISWSPVTGATAYNLYWDTTTGVAFNNGTQIVGVTSPYVHTGRTNGTPYYYVVTATVAPGESADSLEVTATPQPAPPVAPTGVSATPGDGEITISWDNSAGADSYNLYWATATGVSYATGTQITAATSPYVHTGLTNGTPYYYVVTAVNVGGESYDSAEAGATPQLAPPAAPTGVSAGSGDGEVTISWDASTGADSYNLYWSAASGLTQVNGTQVEGAVSPYTHSSLTNDTAYYYLVTAVNAAGESTDSLVATATPAADPAAAPVITDFTPTSAEAGESVTITGGNLTGATAVAFGGVAAADFTVTSDSEISATVGTGASGDLSVTTPGGTVSLAGFTFIQAAGATLGWAEGATGGVDPASGTAETNFTFQVLYTSPDNTPPAVAQLQIDLNGDGEYLASAVSPKPDSRTPLVTNSLTALMAAGVLLTLLLLGRIIPPGRAVAAMAISCVIGLALITSQSGCADTATSVVSEEEADSEEVFNMVEDDAADTDYTDGKLYVYELVAGGEARSINFTFNFEDDSQSATGDPTETQTLEITE